MAWLVGADEDFEEFARLVGDEAWNWENVKERIKRVETRHCEVPEGMKRFIAPKTGGEWFFLYGFGFTDGV